MYCLDQLFLFRLKLTINNLKAISSIIKLMHQQQTIISSLLTERLYYHYLKAWLGLRRGVEGTCNGLEYISKILTLFDKNDRFSVKILFL